MVSTRRRSISAVSNEDDKSSSSSSSSATVKQPVVGNMMKALYFQFTVGVLPLYAVAFMEYWAYGNDSSAYLLNSVSGPVWLVFSATVVVYWQHILKQSPDLLNQILIQLKRTSFSDSFSMVSLAELNPSRC